MNVRAILQVLLEAPSQTLLELMDALANALHVLCGGVTLQGGMSRVEGLCFAFHGLTWFEVIKKYRLRN